MTVSWNSLNTRRSTSVRELDDLTSLLHGDDARGQHTQTLETLVDGRFADAEMAGSCGLRMAGVEIGAEIDVGDFGGGHAGYFP